MILVQIMIAPFLINAKLQTQYTKSKLHQIFKTTMEKSTMEPVKVHLNNDMETYYSITKKLFYYKKHGKDTEV